MTMESPCVADAPISQRSYCYRRFGEIAYRAYVVAATTRKSNQTSPACSGSPAAVIADQDWDDPLSLGQGAA